MTTGRLTISSSRSDMGLLDEPQDPGTPPPVWTPATTDFWKKPSKWQICMPRLTLVAKFVVTTMAFVVLVKVMAQGPGQSSKPPPPPPSKQPTQAEMKEMANSIPWTWNDYPQ